MHEPPDIDGLIPIRKSTTRDSLELEFVELERRRLEFVLLWRLRLHGDNTFGLAEAGGPRGPQLSYQVNDDRGGIYEMYRPVGGSGDETHWEQRDRLRPGLRSEARRLDIRVDAVELERSGTDGRALTPRIWTGPWEFSVELRGVPPEEK